MMGILRPPCQALQFSRTSSTGYPGDRGWEGPRPVQQPGRTGYPRGRRPDKALPVPGVGMLHVQEPGKQPGSAGGTFLNHAPPPGKSP